MDQRLHAAGSGVTHGVTDNDSGSTTVDGGRIKPLDGFRIAAGSIFRHVHDLETKRSGISHGVFGGALQKIVSPVFRVTADRAGAEEACHFNGYSGALRNFGYRTN